MRQIIIVLVVICVVCFGSAIVASAEEKTTQPETTAKQPKKVLKGWHGKRYYVNGKYVVGKKKIKKKYYVFGKNGKVRKKTTKIGNTTYYLNSKSKLEAYKTKKTYYFPSGKKMKSYQKNDYLTFCKARKIVKRITKKKMSKKKKLSICFNWVRRKPYLTHRRFYPSKGWMATYANDHFKRGGGDCHADGSALAYLARAIGYKKVYACLDSSGYTNQGHCWTEINGRVFDPLFIERGKRYKNYNATYHNFGLSAVRKFKVARYY